MVQSHALTLVSVLCCAAAAGRNSFFALLRRMTGTWGKESRRSFKVSGKRLLPSRKMEVQSMVS